jgi:hypothetical protein
MQSPTQQLDQSDNIKVVVRVRPLFPEETNKSVGNVVGVNDEFSALTVSQAVSRGTPGVTPGLLTAARPRSP